MTTTVYTSNVIGADIPINLVTGEQFILGQGVTFFTWTTGFPAGIFGDPLNPIVSVTVLGNLNVNQVQLFGGDRFSVGAQGTTQVNSQAGISLQAASFWGRTQLTNAGTIQSGLSSLANAISLQMTAVAGDDGIGFQLINSGLIQARRIAISTAVDGSAGNLSSHVENSGTISGALAAYLSGAADVLVNHGTMTGSSNATVQVTNLFGGTLAPLITNDGTITLTGSGAGDPDAAAILITRGSAATSGASILNGGTITSASGVALHLDVDSASLRNTGTLNGGIVSQGGATAVLNLGGRIFGDLHFGAGQDSLTNSGQITGKVDMGAGQDLLDLRGGQIIGGSVTGGADGDAYYLDRADVAITEEISGGNDTVFAAVDYRLLDNFETLILLEGPARNGTGNLESNLISGNSSDNRLSGDLGADTLLGGAGDDQLSGDQGNDSLEGGIGNDLLLGGAGIDLILGGEGDDTLKGGLGRDTMTGGLGEDVFVFGKLTHTGATSADYITDFTPGEDTINLAGIDANTTNASPRDAFTFIGNAAFHHVAGELRYEILGSVTWLRMDVNGDGVSDAAIRLLGGPVLTALDFVL